MNYRENDNTPYIYDFMIFKVLYKIRSLLLLTIPL